MKRVLMLTGDINLMNVTDPAVPFARVEDTLRQADVLFGNLECCFYEPGAAHALEREGFYAPLASAQALVIGGYRAIGNGNNVNYGEDAIRSSLARLAGLGIPYTGAGLNRQAARAPAIVTHEGLRSTPATAAGLGRPAGPPHVRGLGADGGRVFAGAPR